MIMHDYTATETLNYYSNSGPSLSMKKSTISCPEKKNGYNNMIIKLNEHDYKYSCLHACICVQLLL